MERLSFKSRHTWREWLFENHDMDIQGIWLVYYKKSSGASSVSYEESVEEALCFGWIDSIIKKIDEESYCRKFTPRKPGSKWSALNKKRIEKLIDQGRMAEPGMRKIDEAKRSGQWEMDARPDIRFEMPSEFTEALKHNRAANDSFTRLSPSLQKQYIAWIGSAKRTDTREKRIQESLRLLEQDRKLGLK